MLGHCNIDHSLSDVKQKFQNQKPFLPEHLPSSLETILTADLSQQKLNDIFHLLKKYDLSSESERAERNEELNILCLGNPH